MDILWEVQITPYLVNLIFDEHKACLIGQRNV